MSSRVRYLSSRLLFSRYKNTHLVIACINSSVLPRPFVFLQRHEKREKSTTWHIPLKSVFGIDESSSAPLAQTRTGCDTESRCSWSTVVSLQCTLSANWRPYDQRGSLNRGCRISCAHGSTAILVTYALPPPQFSSLLAASGEPPAPLEI